MLQNNMCLNTLVLKIYYEHIVYYYVIRDEIVC